MQGTNEKSRDNTSTSHVTPIRRRTTVLKMRSGQATANVTVARPVTLNVGFQTRLLLNVTHEASSSQHPVQG